MGLEKAKKEWIKRQKEFWKNKGEIISEVEDGFTVDGAKRTWENTLYEHISVWINDVEYLHCWSSELIGGSTIYYIDFMCHKKDFRFLFYQEDEQIVWRTVNCVKEDGFYAESFDKLTHKELKTVYQYTKKLYDYVCQFPLYRVKFALRELTIKESCPLVEKYESLMKEEI